MAHPASLTQALANLLDNAVRFVPTERQPHVRLWTESLNGQVRIYVQDNGIGIEAANQPKIWNLFTRLHPERFEGTGIGLAIVKKAAERMGGSVGVESQPGVGSKFWIQLPAAKVQ
jgi:signal transduction histidine kinase